MNIENFRQATWAQVSELGGFWTFITSGASTLSNLNVTTTSGNITVTWSDGTSSNVITSGQNISHTYTL